MSETTRTFFAIEIPEPLGAELAGCRRRLAPELPGLPLGSSERALPHDPRVSGRRSKSRPERACTSLSRASVARVRAVRAAFRGPGSVSLAAPAESAVGRGLAGRAGPSA